jgi:hypothetical protein
MSIVGGQSRVVQLCVVMVPVLASDLIRLTRGYCEARATAVRWAAMQHSIPSQLICEMDVDFIMTQK